VNNSGFGVSDTIIEDSITANPHGAGVYFPNSKTITRFYPKNKKKVSKLLDGESYIAHFRYSSMGTISKNNIHPFMVARRYYLFHNGTMDSLKDKDNPSVSDTRIFAKYLEAFVLKGVDIMGIHFKKMIELLDKKNKFVIFDTRHKKTQIINEDLGMWLQGVWYSKNPNTQVHKYTTMGSYRYNYNTKEQYVFDHKTKRYVLESELDTIYYPTSYALDRKTGECIIKQRKMLTGDKENLNV
jgi:predicted glutamine amidotransferase